MGHVSKFSDLKPGDLFIYNHRNGSSAAIVTITPEHGNIGILTLGPTFPKGGTVPDLSSSLPSTVLSFGKAYNIKLATAPNAWHFDGHVVAEDFMAFAGTDKYVRIQRGHQYEMEYFFVNLTTGHISSDEPDSPIGYVNAWEIFTIGDESDEPQLILRWSPSTS
jgi:hypothetical protein